MTLDVSFFAPGVPAPKGSMRAYTYRRRNGRTGARADHDNAKTKPWMIALAWAARAALRSASFGAAPVMVNLEFVLPRPKKHFGARGLLRSAPEWPSGKPDVDKLIRSCLDALTGIAWTDDAQVVRVHAAKHWQDPSDWRASPGCRVRVVELHRVEALEVRSR